MEIERGNTSCLYLHVLINTDPNNNKLNSNHSEGLKAPDLAEDFETCVFCGELEDQGNLNYFKLPTMADPKQSPKVAVTHL